jgi:hypothetical protein
LRENSELYPTFQAVVNLPSEQQAVIKQLLEGMIIKYEAERWSSKVR